MPAWAWGFESPLRHYSFTAIHRSLPPAPEANRMSTPIHRNPQLSTGFAVSFAVKGNWQNAGCERVSGGLYAKKKELQPTKIAALFICACHQGVAVARNNVPRQQPVLYVRIRHGYHSIRNIHQRSGSGTNEQEMVDSEGQSAFKKRSFQW